MKSELVSSRVEPSSSLPTAMTPAERERAVHAIQAGNSHSRQAQRQVRVDRRHRVVGHHAEAAVQLLRTGRRDTA